VDTQVIGLFFIAEICVALFIYQKSFHKSWYAKEPYITHKEP